VKKSIILILLLFVVRNSFATVDYLAANHLTKELYWFEEDDYEGLGWKSISEVTEENEKNYLSQGYTYSAFPHKSEYLLSGIALLTGLTIVARRRRLKRINRITQ